MIKQYFLLTIALIFTTSCANQMYSWSYSPITTKYSTQLDEVSLGMNKKELKKILPNLSIGGQTYVKNEIIEALELQHNYWAGVGGQLVNDQLWFYFYKGKLIKWGRPNDWPEKPDLIIETRRK